MALYLMIGGDCDGQWFSAEPERLPLVVSMAKQHEIAQPARFLDIELDGKPLETEQYDIQHFTGDIVLYAIRGMTPDQMVQTLVEGYRK